MKTSLIAAAALLSLAGTPTCAAQAEGAPPMNSVYLELLGNGGLYSVNYDRKLSDHAAVRIGVGAWTGDDLLLGSEAKKELVTVPIGAAWLFGSGRGRLEVGAGVLVGRQSQDIPFEDGSTSSGFASLTGTIGYRYQPATPGFVFRAGFTPFLGLGGDEAYPESGFMPSIGLSGGYTFR